MSKDPVRVAAGRKSKRKGSSNERQLAHIFQAWWQVGTFARTPGSGSWSRPGNREEFKACGDIISSDKSFPFCVEAKNQEGWTLDQLIHNEKCVIHSWWKQTVDETPKGLVSLLLITRNHVPQAVIFSAGPMVGLVNSIGKLNPTDPSYPWAYYPHFCFDFVRDNGDLLIIMSLNNFFKISPDIFGRKMPHVTETLPTTTTELP